MAKQHISLLSKLDVSVDATRRFYSTQQLITDDCKCDDCKFYVSTVLSYDFSIYAELSAAGVDVAKNIDSEPTGVWCAVDDGGKLLFAIHAFHIFGRMIDSGYEMRLQFSELGYSFDVTLQQIEDQIVQVDLQIRGEEQT